jgi:4-amino-4-deoxy-L-arabinose transferase-like glycosyltransferase
MSAHAESLVARSGFPFSRGWAADALALGLVVAVFSWICFRNIWQPGYGDEALLCVAPARFVWGQAVVNPFPHEQVTLFGRAFPLMINSYTGPVKAYILALAFGLFGVSVPTMRMTTGLIGLLGIVVLYFLVRRQFGRMAAAARCPSRTRH